MSASETSLRYFAASRLLFLANERSRPLATHLSLVPIAPQSYFGAVQEEISRLIPYPDTFGEEPLTLNAMAGREIQRQFSEALSPLIQSVHLFDSPGKDQDEEVMIKSQYSDGLLTVNECISKLILLLTCRSAGEA